MCSVYIYKGIAGEQKGIDFSASFNAFPLVVSEKMTTLHTHTHTHHMRTYWYVILFHFFLRARETRVIPYKQRALQSSLCFSFHAHLARTGKRK